MDREMLLDLYSTGDLMDLKEGGLGELPYTDPGTSRYANKWKIQYLGKDWVNSEQGRERVEGILRKTARNTRIKTSSPWIRDKIAPGIEKAVYYINKLFAVETGYIAKYGTVEIEEMKEDPYVRDKEGRKRGKIWGVYKRFIDKIGLNPELKEKDAAEGRHTFWHELWHKGKEYMGENSEMEEAFGPNAVPVIEAKARFATYVLRPQIYSGTNMNRYRLATA